MSEEKRQSGAAPLILVTTLIPLLPVAFVPLPPLLDYPNHLARLWLIAGGGVGTPLELIYDVDWSLAWVNIGIDLAALALSPILDANSVGRICIGLSLLLPSLGFILLGRIITHQWHPLLVAGPILSMNSLLAMGFLNHQIAVGLAMLFAAGDNAWRAGPLAKLLPRSIVGASLAVIHPFGAFTFSVIVAGLALEASATLRKSFLSALAGAAFAGVPAITAALVLAALAPHLPGADPRATTLPWLYLPEAKLIGGLAGFVSYDPLPELTLALVLAWLIWLGLRRSIFLRHRGLLVSSLGCIILMLILPSNVGDAGQVEARLGTFALMLGALALLPGPGMYRISTRVLTLLVVLLAIRTAHLMQRWNEGSREIAAVEAVLAALPYGSSLLGVQPAPGPHSNGPKIFGIWTTLLHAPARAVPMRLSFVPTLFSAAGKQPIRVLPPWSARAAPDGILPQPGFLEMPHHPELVRAFPYLRGWRAYFTHVLLIDAPALGADAPATGLELIADGGSVRLYRLEVEAAPP